VTWKPQPNQWEIDRAMERLTASTGYLREQLDALRLMSVSITATFAAFGTAMRAANLPEAPRWQTPRRRTRPHR
jgi:hypothetical protein